MKISVRRVYEMYPVRRVYERFYTGAIMKDIQIRKISKSFGDTVVLKDLSLTVREGKITCIQGPSGCGKTTLLRILSGLDQPSGGEIINLPGKKSFVFQENRLCEDFGAVSNIRLVMREKGAKEIILSHLRELGLGDDLEKPVKEFSGGMKRRVAIARAVCYDADLVLLDEPFKGLDEKLRKRVMDYVKKHCASRTVICVTHDSAEAAYLGDEVIEMSACMPEDP